MHEMKRYNGERIVHCYCPQSPGRPLPANTSKVAHSFIHRGGGVLSWCRVCRVVVMTGLTRYVERLKHDLGRVLAVLWRVEGGLRLRGEQVGESTRARTS